MRHNATVLLGMLLFLGSAAHAENVVRVSDDQSLRAALGRAKPGTHIQIAPGKYRPEVAIARLTGTAESPIVIEGAEPDNPPLFAGGGEGWHLIGCAYVTLRNIAVRGQSSNGINVDDGGKSAIPAHHIVLDGIRVNDVGPEGNHDAIKISGVTDFIVRNCTMEHWGGQAPDMVGCHRGLIEQCRFIGKPGFSHAVGPQIKGGSTQVTVRRCLFLDAGDRGVQMGGATGLSAFRPQGVLYEAKETTVEGCTFVGGEAAVAYVGVDGATVRYNTIYRPRQWVMRILQETTAPGFIPCRNGVFEHNLVVYRRSEVNPAVNIGPHTSPETFRFADNFWYCEDNPAASMPDLPATETGGVYGIDPKLANPARHEFQPLNPAAARFGAGAWKRP